MSKAPKRSRELPEDLIFEIISYLPLRLVAQCKSLSKNFSHQISDPYFQNKHKLRTKTNFDCLLYHSAMTPSPILSKYQSYRHNYYFSSKSILSRPTNMLDKSFTILSSSGGLLLLQFHNSGISGGYNLCVFNPITGAYRIIPSLLIFTANDYYGFGFTYQFTGTNNFKLVAVSLKRSRLKYYYTFFIFQLETNSWYRSRKLLTLSDIDSSPEFLTGFQTIYHEDSFYWLRKDGNILVFNTKTTLSQIISGSQEFTLGGLEHSSLWFDVIENKISIAMVEYDQKIRLYLYDLKHCSWKLDIILYDSSRINDSYKIYPIFYDGKRLIKELFIREIMPKDVRIKFFLAVLTTNLCRKIPSFPYWTDNIKTFRYFDGSLAQIPNCNYLSKKQRLEVQDQESVMSILCCLHQFISRKVLRWKKNRDGVWCAFFGILN